MQVEVMSQLDESTRRLGESDESHTGSYTGGWRHRWPGARHEVTRRRREQAWRQCRCRSCPLPKRRVQAGERERGERKETVEKKQK